MKMQFSKKYCASIFAVAGVIAAGLGFQAFQSLQDSLATSVRISDRLPAAATNCPKGYYPVALFGASSASVRAADPTTLPSELMETTVLCILPSAGSHVPAEFKFVDRGESGVTRTFSREEFSANGYQVSRKIPIYGEIDVISLRCENCDWKKPEQKIAAVTVYQFPKKSSPLTVTLKLNASTQRWELHRQYAPGQKSDAVHVAIFEKEGLGLKRIRFSQCPETRESECVTAAHPSNLKTHSIVEFKAAARK